MNNKTELPRLFVKGHVLITDITDPENVSIVVDKSNAIHPENMSQAIAYALANSQDSLGVSLGAISEMRFGNGGTVVLSTGRVTYKTPRISSFGGLYSETYVKKINANVNAGVETEYNNVSTVHIPSDQNVSSTTDMEGNYVFDELGLYTDGDSGMALSHIIFHPVEKSANRILQIKYTVRVQLQ